jgi:hypothetical protein
MTVSLDQAANVPVIAYANEEYHVSMTLPHFTSDCGAHDNSGHGFTIFLSENQERCDGQTHDHARHISFFAYHAADPKDDAPRKLFHAFCSNDCKIIEERIRYGRVVVRYALGRSSNNRAWRKEVVVAEPVCPRKGATSDVRFVFSVVTNEAHEAGDYAKLLRIFHSFEVRKACN